MSGFIRQIKVDDGTPITPPTTIGTSVSTWGVFANDAAYEAVFGAGQQGNSYFNSTELLLRVHNGTEWVYLQNGINLLVDAASSGGSVDLDPTYHNLLKVTNASLTSVRGINPAQTLIVYLANATGVDILLLHDDAGATANTRLLLPNDENLTLTNGSVAHFVYDAGSSRFRFTNNVQAGGGTGSGQGAKNYVLSPDDSSEIVTTGGVVASDTTDPAEKPEPNTKATAAKIIQSGGAAGDRATWNVNPIDFGDNGRVLASAIYVRPLAGYVDGDATLYFINTTTSQVLGTHPILTTSQYFDSDALYGVTSNLIQPVIEFNVANSAGVGVSGVGVLGQNPVVGALITRWQSYTPSITTGFGTITSNLKWRQVGQSIEIEGTFTAGTTTGVVAQLGLPNGYTVKLGTGVNQVIVGESGTVGGTNTFARKTILASNGNNYLNFGDYIDGGGSQNYTDLTIASTTFATGSVIPIKASIEVNELDGTAPLLDAGALYAAARVRYYISANTNILANAKLPFDTLSTKISPVGNWSIASNSVTVPVSGTYQIKFYDRLNAALAGDVTLTLYIGGIADIELGYGRTGDLAIEGDGTRTLNAGDIIDIRSSGAINTLGTNDTRSWLQITRLQDSSANQAVGAGTSLIADLSERYLLPRIQKATVTLVNSGTGLLNGTVRLLRIDNFVFVSSAGPITHTSSNTPLSAVGVIPTEFRPAVGHVNCFFYDENVGKVVAIAADGQLQIFYRNEVGGVAQTTTSTPIEATYVIS